MHHHTENESSLFTLHSALVLSSSLSSPLLSLSSVSVCPCLSLSPCVVVVVVVVSCVCRVVLCCVVWCVVCDTLKNSVCPLNTSPCVRSKRTRVYQHHAHTCFSMCAWCRHTRGRIGRTHGDVLDGHTGEEEAGLSSVKLVIFTCLEHLNKMLCSSLIANFLFTNQRGVR